MRHLLLISLLASGTATADAPKYTRKHDLHIDVKQTTRTAPIQAAQKPPQHPIGAEAVLLAEEHNAPLVHEQEAILIKLIADTPDTDPDKPDYMFRLAEHYAQELRHWRLRAVEAELDRHP